MPEISGLGFNTHAEVVQLRAALWELMLLISVEIRQLDQIEAKEIFRTRRDQYEGGTSNAQAQVLKKIEVRKEYGCRVPVFCACPELYVVCVARHSLRQSNFRDLTGYHA